MFIAALFTIAKTWKQPKRPLKDEWLKMCIDIDIDIYIHIYIYKVEYNSDIKKNEILLFAATWMDLEIIILSEVSQRKTNMYNIFICRI